VLASRPDLSDDVLEQMVAARTGRQVILDKPEPPHLLVVLDEAVLHRLVGSPKIMHEQLVHLAEASARSHISVQVIPATVGAHAGLGGAFTIATVDGRPDAMHVDSVEGITVEKSALVRKAPSPSNRQVPMSSWPVPATTPPSGLAAASTARPASSCGPASRTITSRSWRCGHTRRPAVLPRPAPVLE
jgi:hypothetical protein